MAFSSFPWPFHRRAGGSGSGGTGPSKPSAAEGKEEDAEELGVTPQLLEFLRTLSPDAFKSFPSSSTKEDLRSRRPSSRTGSSGTLSSCSPEPRNSLRSAMICAHAT
uniref:Uncharacterized protein n=1 Tax=Triticum urartu TaxID=4572 RepID=A0A8R7QXI4_TRIUA